MAEKKPARKPDPKDKGKGKGKKDEKSFKDYGFVKAFLDTHPAVKRAVKQAVKQGWTPQRLEGEVKTTAWWRRTTDAQRKADLLSTSNPAEWNKMLLDAREAIRLQSEQMGLSLSTSELNQYAEQSVRGGYTPEKITSWIARTGDYNQEKATGNTAIIVDEMRKMADDYGLQISTGSMDRYVRDILGGKSDMEGLEDTLREQAKVMFPTIADRLDTGMTVKDYLSPYWEAAANELGVPIASFSTTDPKWTAPLTGPDGVPMSGQQWAQTLRSDASYGWGKSNAAKDIAFGAAARITNLMKGGA